MHENERVAPTVQQRQSMTRATIDVGCLCCFGEKPILPDGRGSSNNTLERLGTRYGRGTPFGFWGWSLVGPHASPKQLVLGEK